MSSENTKRFDINNLSFNAIRTSFSSKPKLMFKRKHYSLYNNYSANNIQDNNTLAEGNEVKVCNCKSNNNEQSDQINVPISYHKHCLSSEINQYWGNQPIDKDEIKEPPDDNSSPLHLLQTESTNITLYIQQLNKNFKEKISLIEIENKKLIANIENTYKTLIDKLTQSYEAKMQFIISQCKSKCINYDQELLKTINEYKSLQSSSILITTHNELMTKLNEEWKQQLSNISEEYKDSFGVYIDLLKSKEEYKSLLIRLENYRLNKLDIRQIEAVLQNNHTNESFGKDYNLQIEKNKLSQLEREILYHKSLFEMKVLAEDSLINIELNTNIKYDKIKKAIEGKFNSWIDKNTEENKDITVLKPNDLLVSAMSHESYSYFPMKLSKRNNTGPILNNRYDDRNIDEEYQHSLNNDIFKSNDKISIDFEVYYILFIYYRG